MSNLEDKIKALEEILLLPEIRQSKEQLDKLLTDKFQEIGVSGNVYSKRQVIEALSKKEKHTAITLFEFEVKQLTEHIVLAL